MRKKNEAEMIGPALTNSIFKLSNIYHIVDQVMQPCFCLEERRSGIIGRWSSGVGVCLCVCLIFVSAEITIPKLPHARNHTEIFVQTRFDLWRYNLYSWETLAHHMNSLGCLQNHHTITELRLHGSWMRMHAMQSRYIYKLTTSRKLLPIIASSTDLQI